MNILSDLGTMLLGVTAILIAGSVIGTVIGIGSGDDITAQVIGALFAGIVGVIFRILGRNAE